MSHFETTNLTNINDKMIAIAKTAKEATWSLNKLSSFEKNALLHAIADKLIFSKERLIEVNKEDLQAAKDSNLSSALIARLSLSEASIEQIANEVRHVASLPDPIGDTLDGKLLDSGLRLERRVVPLGVVAVIYEARPNVTIDVASLCLKTSNVVILRGGKETQKTNEILVKIIQDTLEEFNLPKACVQAITDPDRAWVNALLKQDTYIDMLIPRGGPALHQLCKQNSLIPVITGGIGVCHIYLEHTSLLDAHAQYCPTKSQEVIALIDNAKRQRPSACNSLETLLIDEKIAEYFLPLLYEDLFSKNITFKVCNNALRIFENTHKKESITQVTDKDFSEESLSLTLNIKIVKDIDEAINHIRAYGTGHSDAILTQSMQQADKFIESVDSAAVFVNASTRFTDGAQFGLGAEVAVSTQKLHARGPMGLDALTTYKWIGRGNNTLRS